MLARALATAALALLISGDPARLGWDAAGLWHFVFPYLWLFVLLESFRARRRIEDGEIFFAGAAMALLYSGVYAKDLQFGSNPFGVDWLGIPAVLFDGGMTAVLASHLVARLRPRPEVEPEARLRAILFLVFGLGTAITVYATKTGFNFYRAERHLGATWLVADIAFVAGAWRLAQLARERSEEREEPGREAWIWAVAGYSAWLPSVRVVARFCAAMGLPAVLLYFFVASWTAGLAYLCRQLWRERGHADPAPRAVSRPAALAAGWRITGAFLLILVMGADLNDSRAAGLFSILIDCPTRALFAWAFLTSRLKV